MGRGRVTGKMERGRDRGRMGAGGGGGERE